MLNKNMCDHTTDIYNFYFYKKYFKKYSFFNSYNFFYSIDNKFRSNFMFLNKNLDFLKTDKFVLVNVNLRCELPLLNYKIREKVTFDFIEVLHFGPIVNLNYFFLHFGNNLSYFYKYLNLFKSKEQAVIFFGYLKNNLNHVLNKLNNKNISIFNIYNLNNLRLMFFEFNKIKNLQMNKLKKKYAVNFTSNTNVSNNVNVLNSTKGLNVYLSQNVFNTKFFNFILPKKFNFEQNSFFLNIFGVFNDYTFIIYKSDYKTLKNDWHILEDLFNKFNLKLKISLSLIKSVYIPKNWIYNEYQLKMYKHNINSYNKLFIQNKNIYVSDKMVSFFNDIFSKNNILSKYFDILKKFNLFNVYQNINEIYWIF